MNHSIAFHDPRPSAAGKGDLTRHVRLLVRSRGLIAVVLAFALVPVRSRDREAGMTTAEYAVGTIAACGFAAILYQVVTGDSIISALGSLISRALSTI